MMYAVPIDHLPQTVRDNDIIRREEEIERRKTLFRQARAVSTALRTITDRQTDGHLTKADGAVLAHMVLQNLRACVRKERIYRPTRKRLAKVTGYSQRTVSKSITRLKDAGVLVVSRYAKGGRQGNNGKGLATEFRSGCLQFLTDQLKALGYRVGVTLHSDLSELARWAAAQVGEHTEVKADVSKQTEPTGNLVPGIICYRKEQGPKDKATTVATSSATPEPVASGGICIRNEARAADGAPRAASAAPAARSAQGYPPGMAAHRPATAEHPIHGNQHKVSHKRSAASERPPVSKLARSAMVPMPPFQSGVGTGDPIVLLSLPKIRGGC